MTTSKSLAKVTASKAKAFFTALANLQDNERSIARFERTFEWLGMTLRDFTHPCGIPLLEIVRLRDAIRSAWRINDKRTRRWLIFRLEYFSLVHENPAAAATPEGVPGPLPPATPFEDCLAHLMEFDDRLKYCENAECPAPYFIAKRRNQKYCHNDCAWPAQLEAKMRWWNAVGRKKRLRQRKATAAPR